MRVTNVRVYMLEIVRCPRVSHVVRELTLHGNGRRRADNFIGMHKHMVRSSRLASATASKVTSTELIWFASNWPYLYKNVKIHFRTCESNFSSSRRSCALHRIVHNNIINIWNAWNFDPDVLRSVRHALARVPSLSSFIFYSRVLLSCRISFAINWSSKCNSFGIAECPNYMNLFIRKWIYYDKNWDGEGHFDEGH